MGRRPVGGLPSFAKVVKTVAHAFVIGFFADAILLLMDDDEHRSLSDRVANTVVVRNQPTMM